jgi:DNA-binding transcriptional ArsR family regulator
MGCFLIALFGLSAHLALAATPQNIVSVETRLFSDDTAHVAITITLDSPKQTVIDVPIFGIKDASKITTDANFNDFTCRPIDSYAYDLVLECNVSSIANSRGSFKIEFDSGEIVSNIKDMKKFHQQVIAPGGLDFSRMQLKVSLPENSELVDKYPFDPSVVSVIKRGTLTDVLWTKESVSPTDTFDIRATYKLSNDNVNLAIFYGIIAVLAILAVGGFVYRRKLSPAMVLPVLRPDEKIVMEKLLAHKGLAHQKVLVRESLYSKAKVSKVLKSLEERGVVRLERVGRSNQVFLNSNFDKKAPNRSGNSHNVQNDSD